MRVVVVFDGAGEVCFIGGSMKARDLQRRKHVGFLEWDDFVRRLE